MNFVTRLFVFAIAMTVGVGGYKLVRFVAGPREKVTVVHIERGTPDVPAPPAPPEAPGAVALVAPAAGVAVRGTGVSVGTDDRAWDVRIATTNGAAFMGLRDDQLIAGLSDSIRALAVSEMHKEMTKEPSNSGFGRAIEKAVASGVEGILGKQIEVPLADIRSIDYRHNRIEIRYKRGAPSGILNLETVKGDGNRTILEQFSESDARRLVDAVQARLK